MMVYFPLHKYFYLYISTMLCVLGDLPKNIFILLGKIIYLYKNKYIVLYIYYT